MRRQNLAEALAHVADPLEVSTRVVNACADAKGKEITVLDASGVSDLSSYFVIVSGTSDRHVQGITNKVIDKLAEEGIEPCIVEGLEQAHWVLIDFGDVIMHVFYEPVRTHFNLEGLYAKAPRVPMIKGRSGYRLKGNKPKSTTGKHAARA